MAAPKRPQNNQEPPTTGHVWDGIEEFDNPMPRWWIWTFYLTIIWGVIYTIFYPAWPLVTAATSGVLGYSTRGAVAAEIAQVDAQNQVFYDQLVATDPNDLADNADLHRFAVNAGAAVFRAQCVQCHGAGGAGVQAGGFPNLLDDEWLWGGTSDAIVQTITYGIRNEDFPDARWSEMPAFGREEILTADEIDQVVQHVLHLSGQANDATMAAAGAELFLDNCAACHGDNGEGVQDFGAPALNNAVWLYGGDADTIRESIHGSRFGVMPGFTERLPEAQIRAVAAYVHQLGGGE